jgi:hypothetical protein
MDITNLQQQHQAFCSPSGKNKNNNEDMNIGIIDNIEQEHNNRNSRRNSGNSESGEKNSTVFKRIPIIPPILKRFKYTTKKKA